MEPYITEYFDKLTKLIEQSYEETSKPIVLISHSMGGPLINLLLSKKPQKWKDKYIKGWITINGVFGGSIKAFLLNTFGYSDIIPSYILSTDAILRVFSSFPSTYYLQLSPNYFEDEKVFL